MYFNFFVKPQRLTHKYNTVRESLLEKSVRENVVYYFLSWLKLQ